MKLDPESSFRRLDRLLIRLLALGLFLIAAAKVLLIEWRSLVELFRN